MMHLNYSILTRCWILLLLFIMSYEMGKVFAFLKFSITLLLYSLNQILLNPRNWHLLVSHFPSVVLYFLPELNDAEQFILQLIFTSLLCILNPFTTSLLMLNPLNRCSRWLICFMGFAISWYIFPWLSLNNFYCVFLFVQLPHSQEV